MRSGGVRKWLALIVTAALAVRLAYVGWADGGRFRTEEAFSDDGVVYDGMARSLAAGGGLSWQGKLTSYREPLYPLYLSVFHRLSSRPLFAARVGQCVIGAATVAAVFVIGAQAHGWVAGMVAAAATAVMYEMAQMTPYIMEEVLFTAFYLTAILLLGALYRGPGFCRAAAAGAALGASILVRSLPLLLPAFLVPWFLWIVPDAGSRARRCGLWLAFAAAAALVVLPWTLRNAWVHRAFVPVTLKSGELLYAGHGPGATGGSGGWLKRDVDWQPLPGLDGLVEVEADRRLARAGLRCVLDDPLRSLALAPRKLWNMWRPWLRGASRLSTIAVRAQYLPLMALAAAGLFVNRRGWRRFSLLYLVLAYSVVLHAALTAVVRQRYPLIPILTVLASAAAVEIATAARARARVWSRIRGGC